MRLALVYAYFRQLRPYPAIRRLFPSPLPTALVSLAIIRKTLRTAGCKTSAR